jgi:hypothetical protein
VTGEKRSNNRTSSAPTPLRRKANPPEYDSPSQKNPLLAWRDRRRDGLEDLSIPNPVKLSQLAGPKTLEIIADAANVMQIVK